MKVAAYIRKTVQYFCIKIQPHIFNYMCYPLIIELIVNDSTLDAIACAVWLYGYYTIMWFGDWMGLALCALSSRNLITSLRDHQQYNCQTSYSQTAHACTYSYGLEVRVARISHLGLAGHGFCLFTYSYIGLRTPLSGFQWTNVD